MARYHSPREQVTATGIRIVGPAAAELVARAANLQVGAPPPGDVLWAARFRIRPRIGSGSPLPPLFQAIGDLIRTEWDACPSVTRDTPFSRPPGRFHGVSWDVIGEPGAWRGELVWRHRHPVLAGTPCMTHLVIDEQQHVTSLTLCSASEGGLAAVRGIVGAGQSRPQLLDTLRSKFSLTSDDFGETPRVLADREVEPFVRDVMLSETRTWPVGVLTPLEHDEGFLVPPDQLAAELFGLAPLYVVERHASTFRLTNAIGDRRLSAYWGALRVYRPDFSCADRSDDHWLLLRDRIGDPIERTALVGKLGMFAAARHAPFVGVSARKQAIERATSPATIPVPASALSTAPLIGPVPGATPPLDAAATFPPASLAALGELPGTLHSLAIHLRDLSGTIAHLVAANTQLADEIARLRTTTAIRASNTNAMERRLGSIEALLQPPQASEDVAPESNEPDDDDSAGPTLVDVVRHAGAEYGDALLVLDSAEQAAMDSRFEDIDRVAAVLQAVAYVARRRQEGGLETGLRAAFRELGIDYRSGISESTSSKLRKQYQFSGSDHRLYDCSEHIALGATYDPRHCLRIYFTSRAPSESRFVIGHVGRHLTNMTSS